MVYGPRATKTAVTSYFKNGSLSIMFQNSKGPELPAWVFLALRLGALVAVAIAAVVISRCTA